MKNIKLTRI